MAAQCDRYDELEKRWIDVRYRSRSLVILGNFTSLTDAQKSELFQQEFRALRARLDHRAEHGCRRPGE
jgi:hypothetical protein